MLMTSIVRFGCLVLVALCCVVVATLVGKQLCLQLLRLMIGPVVPQLFWFGSLRIVWQM